LDDAGRLAIKGDGSCLDDGRTDDALASPLGSARLSIWGWPSSFIELEMGRKVGETG
jgi:hypothetical protein